jgi:hypothetical protein
LTVKKVECKCYLHSQARSSHAYRSMSSESRLVAAGPSYSRFYDREWTNGLLAP